MKPDPILRQVYRMKDQLARDTGNNVGRLFRLLRESADQHPDRIVNLRKAAGERAKRPDAAKR